MRRWRVAAIGQMDVFLHPAVFLFAVYSFLTGHGSLWMTAMLSIIVHEAAHALASAALGCDPSSIEITPMGAVMLLEDELKLPPVRRAFMLLAGPAASLCLCWLAAKTSSLGWFDGSVFYLSNLAICLFNMLPVYPLDGGRLLHLFLSRLLPLRTAARTIYVLSSIAGAALILLNIFVSQKFGGWNLSLAFAGCSILYSASTALTSSRLHELRAFMDRKIALETKGSMRCEVVCSMANQPIRRLLYRLPCNRQSIHVIIEPGTMAVLGTICENELIQHYLNSPGSQVADALILSKNTAETTKYDTI